MVVPARGLDPITSTMHYPHHQEDANAFRVSNDFYEFSKCSENLRYRTPSKPVFDIPLETTSTENPLKLSKFFCNCRYLWLRELHGLSTTMMHQRSIFQVKEMNFPALVFCPKNADGLQYDSLYEDFVANVGYADNNTADEVIQYIIAGSGFDNVDVTRWSDEDKMELNNLYNTWRANRTVLEMFDFIFNQNGYRCDEFFDSCWAGSQILNCCEIFKPVYVMLRGRCFRLVDDYKQKDVDENAKISIQLNNVQTGSLTGRKNRIQVVLYIGDAYQEVGIYPRVYLNYHDWNRLRFVQRRLSMLPNNPQCSLAPLNQGKSTCFVYNWLMRVVVNPLNCTVPYFKGMLPYVDDVPSCEPLLLVNNYANITSTILENYHVGVSYNFQCLPACERIENHMQMTTSPDYSRQFSYSFRVEASFTDLQYESYSEIRLTSPAGFISELGGQSGLFVGCSVMSFVQLILSVLSLFVIFARKIYVRYFSLALNVKVIPADDIVENVPIKK
ncbi:unnamed protein product [Haemonchus placei]|uniref:Protein kinase domain-containing protein n=1 Tax=Haemonchus placei TaxID=6290 RepID=A0A0N4WQ27_HAEPC|nr:unnamed protein product [Haemonchus placei]